MASKDPEVTPAERRLNGMLLLIGIAALVIQFPEYSDETRKIVDVITYVAVLQPLYSLYRLKKWPTLTLLLTVVVVHVIQQTCNDWENACVPGFDLVKQIQEQRNSSLITEDAHIVDQLHRQEINNILTVFSYMHLFASASEKPDMLATLQPLLVLAATLSIFINQAALALVVIGLFATARTLRNIKYFSLVDYLMFLGLTVGSITFFFLDMHGYFYVLYCMAFTFMAHSAIRNPGKNDSGYGYFLQLLQGKRPSESRTTTEVGTYGEGLGLTRVDIE